MGKSCVLGKASVWMLKSPRMMTGVIVAIATWNPEDRGRSMGLRGHELHPISACQPLDKYLSAS